MNVSDTFQLPVPLVLGVTGHRDLRPGDIDDLKEQVRQIFGELRASYPSTPLILISSLAEGADRLVAEVALEPAYGTRLVVPLPMPQALYETDFDPAGSLEEFRKLLAQADYCFTIPLPEGVSEDAVAESSPARDRQYELMGQYVAHQSQILIALWDGVDSGKTGGTSEVIKFQTQGLPPGRERELEQPELFPVYWIATPRDSNPVPSRTAFSREVIYPPVFRGDIEAAKLYYDRAFGNSEEFNRLMIEDDPKLLAQVAQSKKDCVGGDLEDSDLSVKEALMLTRYGFADALAIRYQKRLVRTHLALHVLVFFSYLSFVLSTELEPLRYYCLSSALVFFVGSVVAFLRARFGKLDAKTEDYRAMAEGCRLRFFWQLAGIKDSVSDRYLGEQRTELDWIRRAIFGWELDLQNGWPGTWTNLHERVEFVLEHWVDAQRHYFDKACSASGKRAERFENVVKWFIFAGVGIALLQLVGVVLPIVHEWTDSYHVIVATTIDSLLAAGAILHHYSERRAHKEHEKQYERMEQVHRNAARMIRADLNASDLPGALRSLRNLGDKALAESGSWVLLHRARPLELPHP
jgi:hypothetical protein